MLTRYHKAFLFKALSGRVSPRALQAITRANIWQDNLSKQIGHDEYHFDNNAFEQSYAYIEEQRAVAIAALQKGKARLAWAAFGRLTHTAHDFYSHSNYVDLWLARFSSGDGASSPPPPSEIAPLMDEILADPALHSGKIYFPWDALSFIPFLRPMTLARLPKDSHAWMNLDSPKRGEKFSYAFVAAVKRTTLEFDKTLDGLSPEQIALFCDLG